MSLTWKSRADMATEATFSELQRCIEALRPIAPVPDANVLRRILPEPRALVSRMIAAELIKFDMGIAADLGLMRPIEFYLSALDTILPAEAVPIDLVMEEWKLRREFGEELEWSEMQKRFPHLTDTLAEWLAASRSSPRFPTPKEIPQLALHQKFDDFFVLSLLGKGAFAHVYLAKQESMQRLVALKVSGRQSDEPVALSQLDHRNIVRVFDQRQLSNSQIHLIYMQFVPGGTLADCIERLRGLPRSSWIGRRVLEVIDDQLRRTNQTTPESSAVRDRVASMEWTKFVAWIGIQLAEALQYAHDRSILHRDIKPANILLSMEGVPKLADFNVSYRSCGSSPHAAACFGGSLAYMSPEQLRAADPRYQERAEDLDERSDLFSLGIVLWELWKGTRPWQLKDVAQSWSEAIDQQLALRETEIPTEKDQQDSVSQALEGILRKVLAEDRDKRPRNGSELASRLRLVLNPSLARRFEPHPKSMQSWVQRFPVFWLACIVVYLPNALAARSNYMYNQSRVESLNNAELLSTFQTLSLVVNLVAFPAGAAILYFLCRYANALRIRSRQSDRADSKGIQWIWDLGHRMATIGGLLWFTAGIVFAVVLRVMQPDFHITDSIHFFGSLVVCGGVAWIYPFFGISLICVLYYYPEMIRNSIQDSQFAIRKQRLMRLAGVYLGSAAVIPLVSLALLISTVDTSRFWLLLLIGLTGLGLFASFFAYRKLEKSLADYQSILDPNGANITPFG